MKISEVWSWSKERVSSILGDRIVFRTPTKFEKYQRKFKWSKEEIEAIEELIEDYIDETIEMINLISEEDEDVVEEEVRDEPTDEDTSNILKKFVHKISIFSKKING